MTRLTHAAPGFPSVPKDFPIIMTESMQIVEPLFRYLRHISTVPGRSHSPKTLHTYSQHLSDFFDTLETHKLEWRYVTEFHLAEYRNSMLDKPSPHTGRPYSRATINQRVRAVIRFYKWAHRRGLIDELPFGLDEVRAIARDTFLSHTEADPRTVAANELTLPEFQRIPHALSERDQRRLIRHLADPYLLMAKWAIATGLRRTELCSLVTIQIPEVFNLSHRDRKSVDVRIRTTKGGGPRTIRVPLRLIDHTHRYITEKREEPVHDSHRSSSSYRPSDALFLNDNRQPVTPALATRKFAKAFGELAINATLHSLRHTFAIRARPRTIESEIVEFLIERLAASWWAQLFARMTFGVRPTGLRGDHCACMCDGCVSSKSAIEGPAGCGIGRCRQGTEEWPNRYNATLLFVWMHVEV